MGSFNIPHIDTYYVIAVILAYFLGSISPSILIARANGIDIKKEGSGNAGTTNALRVMGKKAAAITLFVDIGKGILAVSLAFLISGKDAAMMSVLAAFIGHVWPVEFGFKGGKGVAVAFGTLLRLDFRIALILALILILTVLVTRKVSLGSIIAALCLPVLSEFLMPEFFYIGACMSLIMIIKHRENIGRLVKGEEDGIDLDKIFRKKK